MTAEIDSDRDDITVDTSRDAMVRRAVAHLAHWVTKGYDGEFSEGLPPTPEDIEMAVRSPEVRMAMRMAIALIWPEWSDDAYSERPADLEPLVIAKACELCGV